MGYVRIINSYVSRPKASDFGGIGLMVHNK